MAGLETSSYKMSKLAAAFPLCLKPWFLLRIFARKSGALASLFIESFQGTSPWTNKLHI